MAELLDLALIGVSHRTAEAATREKLSIPPDKQAEYAQRLLVAPGVRECCVLSTCNRTELLVGGELERELVERLAAEFGAPVPDLPRGAVYHHLGIDAILHLFRVSAGLDSQVLGESQILAQIKDAQAKGKESGATAGVLFGLVEHAIAVGKRVRAETKLGEGTLSVASAAIELAGKVIGGFDDCDALIVGAGETGLLVAQHLKDREVRSLSFSYRTMARGEEAGAKFGGAVLALDQLRDRLSDCHLVLACVDVFEPIITKSHLDKARLRRHREPPMFIDLSMPRAIDPALRDRDDLLLHDLDDLESIVARHRASRESEVVQAGRIVVEETHKYLALRTYASFKPVIADLATRFMALRDQVVAEQGISDPGSRKLADQLTKRLLDEALKQLKDGARRTLSEERLERRYRSHSDRS